MSRSVENWERIERTFTLCSIDEQPPEAWHWRDIRVVDRIEAVERLRRGHHGWEQGHEPALERIARVIELP